MMAAWKGKDNISNVQSPRGKEMLLKDLAESVGDLLINLGIDYKLDPNMRDTPTRVAKMLLEVMHGRYDPKPIMTAFPNDLKIDQMYCVGPVDIRSMCSHHLVPIIGQAWFGIVADKDSHILGLSKFGRLADWIFARPHMQEEATKMLADELETICKPKGIGLVVRATHMCTVWRGLKAKDSQMVTSEMRGVFRNHEPRAEFFNIIHGMGF